MYVLHGPTEPLHIHALQLKQISLKVTIIVFELLDSSYRVRSSSRSAVWLVGVYLWLVRDWDFFLLGRSAAYSLSAVRSRHRTLESGALVTDEAKSCEGA